MSWGAIIVAGVGVGTSVYKGIKAGQANKKAKAEANSLRRPFERVQDEYFQNRNISEEEATGGLSVDEKGFLQQQRDRGLGASAESLERSGGSPNDFARLNGIFDDSLKSEAALDAQQHLQNINFFTQANKDVAGQKTIQWGVNEYQPFESKLKELQDRRIAAQTNMNNAIDEGIGSASAIGTGLAGHNWGGGRDNGSVARLSSWNRNNVQDIPEGNGSTINAADSINTSGLQPSYINILNGQ